MKRLHLFEFEDQPWFPSIFRGFITDLLYYQLTTFAVYKPIVPMLKEVMQKLNYTKIVDLCSGSAGALLQIQESLVQDENYPVSVILTDKYPNLEAFQRLEKTSEYNIDYIADSVDVTAVSTELTGFRTLFTSFHHFQPDIAKQILLDAVNKNTPIGIFEFTERTIINVIKVLLFGVLLVLLQTPFLRPFKWSRIFWTYFIPIVPLVYSWDALASHLRTYSLEELNELTGQIKENNYVWQMGKVKSPKSGFNITYLIGFKPSD